MNPITTKRKITDGETLDEESAVLMISIWPLHRQIIRLAKISRPFHVLYCNDDMGLASAALSAIFFTPIITNIHWQCSILPSFFAKQPSYYMTPGYFSPTLREPSQRVQAILESTARRAPWYPINGYHRRLLTKYGSRQTMQRSERSTSHATPSRPQKHCQTGVLLKLPWRLPHEILKAKVNRTVPFTTADRVSDNVEWNMTHRESPNIHHIR